jgi:hypothetical protein
MVNKETGEKAIDYGANGELVVADWAKDYLFEQSSKAIANA